MYKPIFAAVFGTLLFAITGLLAQDLTFTSVPEDFPNIEIPDQPEVATAMRDMFWMHYNGSGPKSTFWDAWLAPSSLWPDTTSAATFRNEWQKSLTNRKIDADGYVSSHQHPGLAHADGWPFPLWTQSDHGAGWQFTLHNMMYDAAYGIYETEVPDGFELMEMVSDGKDPLYGWKLRMEGDCATLTTPTIDVDPKIFPFVRLLWFADQINSESHVFLEWTNEHSPNFTENIKDKTIDSNYACRLPVTIPEAKKQGYSMVRTEQCDAWTKGGTVTQMRLVFENFDVGTIVTIANWITAYDSRHTVNQSRYVRGCYEYINRTGDIDFLRANIVKMRRAMEFSIVEFQVEKNHCAVIPWTGHDGRSGLVRTYDNIGNTVSKTVRHGIGIGGNYWDILPFGGKDCLTTIYHYDGLRVLAELEQQIDAHPEWNIPIENRRTSESLLSQSRDLRQSNDQFWDAEKGRFVANIDIENVRHDYGFTFLNLEAIYYGYANERQAKAILEWIDGERTIEGDTSTGDDIYHWRFAPRATTKRNLDWYFWGWNNPESIPFGYQIQDGGAVLGFSYHDLMARMKVKGPENTAKRLTEIAAWFEDIRAAGGYRKYYKDQEKGTLQGSNVPGGLGMDREFFESVMTPQIILDGFVGFTPHLDGFDLDPKLPEKWRSIAIDKILWQDQHLSLQISRDHEEKISITFNGPQREIRLKLPAGDWCISEQVIDNIESNSVSNTQTQSSENSIVVSSGPRGFLLMTRPGKTVQFIRTTQIPQHLIIDNDTIRQWSDKFRNWTYYPELVIAEKPNIPGYEDFHSTDCPTVFQIPNDPKWYMSFIAFNGKGYNTFLAESDDLIHWSNPRLLIGFGPENEFDHGGRVLGAYLYDSWNIDAPRTLKKLDGKFWSLYGCYPLQGGYELRPGYEGIANSSDGFIWNRAQSSWILSIYEPDRGSWEQSCIYQPWLVEHDGFYYNFYNAAEDGHEQTGVAFSDDLLSWKRYPLNPVVKTIPGGFNEQFSSDPKVYFDEAEGHWTMFFFGVGQNGAHIMVAFSYDLLHWFTDPNPIYKAGGHPNGLDAQYAHKTSLVYDKTTNRWFLYYCATGTQGRGIGLLTSP